MSVTIDSGTIQAAVIGASAFVGSCGILYAATVRPMLRGWRQVAQIHEDLTGVPGRPGWPAIPGIAERLMRVEERTNALAGQVDRIEQQQTLTAIHNGVPVVAQPVPAIAPPAWPPLNTSPNVERGNMRNEDIR